MINKANLNGVVEGTLASKEAIDRIPEFVNFKKHALSLETINFDTINVGIDSVKPGGKISVSLPFNNNIYRYVQDIILHIKVKLSIEEATKIANKIIKSVEIQIGGIMIEKLNENILEIVQRKRNKKIYLVKNKDETTSIYISLPFDITSGNNIYLQSFANYHEFKINIQFTVMFPKYDDLFGEILFTAINIDTLKNKNYPVSWLSNYKKNIVFSNLYEEIHMVDYELKQNKEITWWFNKKRLSSDLYFYFVNDSGTYIMSDIITEKVFNKMTMSFGTNKDKTNNIEYLSFLNGSSLKVDDYGIYSIPLQYMKNNDEEFTISFNLTDEYLHLSENVKLVMFTYNYNVLMYNGERNYGTSHVLFNN